MKTIKRILLSTLLLQTVCHPVNAAIDFDLKTAIRAALPSNPNLIAATRAALSTTTKIATNAAANYVKYITYLQEAYPKTMPTVEGALGLCYLACGVHEVYKYWSNRRYVAQQQAQHLAQQQGANNARGRAQ